jgi:hypothetical protein
MLTRYVLQTNFYPRYGAANDQVDAVLEVHPIYFQRVIPRYRISTSETRDLGVGPAFDAAVFRPRYPVTKAKPHLEPLPFWKGRRIDVLA